MRGLLYSFKTSSMRPLGFSPPVNAISSFGSNPRNVYRPQISWFSTLSNKKQWLLTFFNIRKTSIGVRTSENSSPATGTARYPTAFCLNSSNDVIICIVILLCCHAGMRSFLFSIYLLQGYKTYRASKNVFDFGNLV